MNDGSFDSGQNGNARLLFSRSAFLRIMLYLPDTSVGLLTSFSVLIGAVTNELQLDKDFAVSSAGGWLAIMYPLMKLSDCDLERASFSN